MKTLGEKILLLILVTVSILINIDNRNTIKRLKQEEISITIEFAEKKEEQVDFKLIAPKKEEIKNVAKTKTSQELLNTLDFDLLLEITAQVESDNRNVAPRQVCYSKGNCTVVRGKYQIEDKTANWIRKMYKVEGDKNVAKQLYIHRLKNEAYRLQDKRANWSCDYFVVYKAYFNSYKGATTIKKWESAKKIVLERRAKNDKSA